MLKMLLIPLLFLAHGIICADDCEELRIENRLLRELLAVQNNNKYRSTQTTSGLGQSLVASSVTVAPTWSISSYTSTYPTTTTLPISTEIPLYFNGKLITSTIVEYETREIIGTTVLPTSVLVYPSIKDAPHVVSTSKDQDIEITSTTQGVSISPSKVQSSNRHVHKTAALRKPPGFRPKLSSSSKKSTRFSSPKSFTLSKAKFGGFGSTGFNRFKREYPANEGEIDSGVELQSGMEL
jgi:hypothetical protein